MDFRDKKIIDTIDAFGKTIESQVDEGIIDWFKDKLGLSDQDAKLAADAAEEAGANKEVTPKVEKPATSGTDGAADAAANTTANTSTVGDDADDDSTGGTANNANAGVDGAAGATANNVPDESDPGQSASGDDAFALAGQVQAGQAGPNNPTKDTPTATNVSATTPEKQYNANLMKAYNDGGKKAMPEIKDMQQKLKDLGFDPKGVDGKYGNGTYAAVQAFQKANNLTVDGQAGPNTLKAIDAAAGKTQQASADTGASTAGVDGAADAAANAGASNATTKPANTQTTTTQAKPDAETQKIIDQINQELEKLANAKKPAEPQVVSTSFDRDDAASMRNAANLIENLLTEDKLDDLIKQLAGTAWAKSNPDAFKQIQDKVTTSRTTTTTGKTELKPSGQFSSNQTTTTKSTTTKTGQSQGQGQNTQGNNLALTAVNDLADNIRTGKDPIIAQLEKELKDPNWQDYKFNGTWMNYTRDKAVEIAGNKEYGLSRDDSLEIINGYGRQQLQAAVIGYFNKKYMGGGDKNFKVGNTNRFFAQVRAKMGVAQGTAPERVDFSKDNNMTDKTNVTEASMNISMNGQDAREVAELVAILKNAGMPDAKPIAHMHMDAPEEPMDASPCGMGEEVVDEWENSPDGYRGEEEYSDTQTMTQTMAGGLNGPKKRDAIRVKDPKLETSIKEQLWAALNEKFTTEGRGRGRGKKMKEVDVQTTEGRGRGRGKKMKEVDVQTTEGRGKGRGRGRGKG